MKVSGAGEFGLIKLLSGMVSAQANEALTSWRQLVTGIGDDAAVWRGETGNQLATIDTLTQDIHFSLDIISWRELGWKALAVNLSDIAAMGGVPRYALVSLALPGDTGVDAVRDLYAGLLEMAQASGVAIVGGDTTRAPLVSLTVAVLAVTGPGGGMLSRDAARPGDMIAVTGYPGAAAAGFRMLRDKLSFSKEAAAYLRGAFHHPVPRLAEGRLLVEQGVRAAIDISDGLLADLGHICESSRVGAVLRAPSLPLHPAVVAGFGDKAVELALCGGEDYELLFTAGAKTVDKVKAGLGCPVTVIGDIREGGGVDVVDTNGEKLAMPETGWDHFKEG